MLKVEYIFLPKVQPRPWIQQINDLEQCLTEIGGINRRLQASYYPSLITSQSHINWLKDARRELADRALELGATPKQLEPLLNVRLSLEQ
jgi:hypothetical protein